MYKVRFLYKNCCRYTDYDPCQRFTIWNIKSYTTKALSNILNFITPCKPECFPFIYWTVLTMSILGFIFSIFEFCTIYHGNKELSTFRDRRFKVLPYVLRKNGRLIGSALMAQVYFLLFVGVTTVSPKLMIPWLETQRICLCIEIALWFCDILSNEDCLTFAHVVSYTLFVTLWRLTQCVKDVFEGAIELNEADDLILIRRPF